MQCTAFRTSLSASFPWPKMLTLSSYQRDDREKKKKRFTAPRISTNCRRLKNSNLNYQADPTALNHWIRWNGSCSILLCKWQWLRSSLTSGDESLKPKRNVERCGCRRTSANVRCESRQLLFWYFVQQQQVAVWRRTGGWWVGGVRVYANRWPSGDPSLFDNSLVQWRTSVLSVRPRCRKFRVGLTRERSSTVSLRCAERTKRRRSIPSASF